MKKPLPVKIVEAIAWIYVALSVLVTLWTLVGVCRDGGDLASGLLGVVLVGVFSLALSFGMLLSLRRGRRVWFLLPNTLVMLYCLIGFIMALRDTATPAMLPLVGVVMLFLVGPIVLLHLPLSNQWFNELSGDDGPDGYGCASMVCVAVLFLGVFMPMLCELLDRRATVMTRAHALAIRGRELRDYMCLNRHSRESGEDWIDASSCTNSMQLVNALCDKLGKERRSDEWCIAVNPPDDDNFPVLVSANIDPRELLCPQDENRSLKLTCPKEWGGACFKFCEKMGVVVFKGGAAQMMKQRQMMPRQIFYGRGIPKPNSDTYFLTPTGRVDLVERQE